MKDVLAGIAARPALKEWVLAEGWARHFDRATYSRAASYANESEIRDTDCTCPVGFACKHAAADTVIHYDPWWNPSAEKPGDRPRPPHRPEQAGLRPQARLPRHHRGPHPGPAEAQVGARRGALVRGNDQAQDRPGNFVPPAGTVGLTRT